MATYFPTTSPAPPCQARAVLQITWDMDLLTRNAELCWMTPAKLPTKFKLCTTSKSKTSLKKKIKKEGKKKKKLQQRMKFGVCLFCFFPSFCCGRGYEARVLLLKYTTANFQHEEIVEGRHWCVVLLRFPSSPHLVPCPGHPAEWEYNETGLYL